MINTKKTTIEPEVAKYITQYDNETYSDAQLADILRTMCTSGEFKKALAMHLFGILYAPHLNSGNLSKVVAMALPKEVSI